MPIVPVQTWALPDNEVDCLPGGFLYDDAGGTIERSAKPQLINASAVPDQSWTKAEIQAWFDVQGIDYSSSATKAELLTFVSDFVD